MGTKQKKQVIVSWSAVAGIVIALCAVSYTYGELWLRTGVLIPVIITPAIGLVLLTWPVERHRIYLEPGTRKKIRNLSIIGAVMVAFGLTNLLIPGVGLLLQLIKEAAEELARR